MSENPKTSETPAEKLRYKSTRALRVGFVPLIDSAPLIMAQELGLFRKYGIKVELKRELGWATVRDKILFRELDGAQALAGMPLAATLGLGSVPCECVTGLVLNLHGNAITLSKELWERGVRDARSFKREIEDKRSKRVYTLGVVFPFSTHNFILRDWLISGGIDPDRDVRLVVVPAPAMFQNLLLGNLDGYCVGEPWNSLAVQSGLGWCPATTAQLAPLHPEKVFMVRRDFAAEHEDEHLALLAALYEACQHCDKTANRAEMVATLARKQYLNVDPDLLKTSLISPTFDLGFGRTEFQPDFHVFFRNETNDPSEDKASWVLKQFRSHKLVPDPSALRVNAGWNVFRSDLFQKTKRLVDEPSRHETTEAIEPLCR